eukprot:364505-Chlamydomonas_euryale.AAC.13
MRATTPLSFGVAARNARSAAMPDDAPPGSSASGVLFSDDVSITAAALPTPRAAAGGPRQQNAGFLPVCLAVPSEKAMVSGGGAAVGSAAERAPLGRAVQASMAAGIMGGAGPDGTALTAETQRASQADVGGEPSGALAFEEVTALQLPLPKAAAGVVEAKEGVYRREATEQMEEEESVAKTLTVPCGPLAEKGVEQATEGAAAEANNLDEVAFAGGAGVELSYGGHADKDAMTDEVPSFVQTAPTGDHGVPGGVLKGNFTVKTNGVTAKAAPRQASQAADADAVAAAASDDHVPCTPPLAPRLALASVTLDPADSFPAASAVVGCDALCCAGSISSCDSVCGRDGGTSGSGRRHVVARAVACAAVCGQLAAAAGLCAIAALNARSRARFVAAFGTSDVCLVGSCYDEHSFKRFKARQAVWEA